MIIIKGNRAGSVGFWSQHLLRDDTNERAQLVEIKGLTAENLPAALREMAAVAAGSRSHGDFMYQANINPQADERLTPKQWLEAVDTLERNLGFEGHQRVVVEHVKGGRQHYHVVWNRVDVDTMKVADIGGNYAIHTKTARQLERDFDLTPSPAPMLKKEAAPELWEIRAAERSGITPAQVKQDATQAWQNTVTGAGFVAAIEAKGYLVAQGDRRDFCLVDAGGTAHSMARRIEDAKAADIRERMAGLDKASFPTVAEARAAQTERAANADRMGQALANVSEIAQVLQVEPQPVRTPEKAVERPQPAQQAKPTPMRQPVSAQPVRTPEKAAERPQPVQQATPAPPRPPTPAQPVAAPKPNQQAERAAAVLPASQIAQGIKTNREADQQAAWQKRATAEREQRSPTPTPAQAGLRVVGAASGAAMGLMDFVSSILGGGTSQPAPSDDFSRSGQLAAMREQRRATEALENIRESVERGEGLRASDVAHLTPAQLINVKLRGDAAMLEMISDMERRQRREQEPERGFGRERER